MICREKYLNELIKAKNNGFPKVITGIRRCGKSYLLNYIYRQTLSKLIINATSAGNSVEWIEAFYPEYIMRISINQYWIASFLMLLLEYIILSVLFYGRVKRGIFYE